MTRAIINQVIACPAGTLLEERDKAIICLAYDTLCRRSELAALDLADLDQESGTVLIRRSKTDQEGQG